jgi:hypothetical protein
MNLRPKSIWTKNTAKKYSGNVRLKQTRLNVQKKGTASKYSRIIRPKNTCTIKNSQNKKPKCTAQENRP